MIGKLSGQIDKDSFMINMSNRISQYDHIIMDLFVSNVCNLHCKHCYFLDYKPRGEPLTLQKWYSIIDDSIAEGIRNFHFSGKEPFCDKRIPLILDYLNRLSAKCKIRYGLVTNGTLLTPLYLQGLIDSNISYIEFSLEGDYLYNSQIRGINSYETIYELIRVC